MLRYRKTIGTKPADSDAGWRGAYERLDVPTQLTAETWTRFVSEALVEQWLAAYRVSTSWRPEITEIDQGSLTFLFDAAPTFKQLGYGDDRVVAVWGLSSSPEHSRDRRRLAGFLPLPDRWSGGGLDRGHFVAHTAGGGLDLNLFPQLSQLNRGRSAQGRRWREMERYAAQHPLTPLFVRPSYSDNSWRPATIDYGLVRGGELWVERFDNAS